jgi:formylglycine-generating enzyme required for sulfatase activity
VTLGKRFDHHLYGWDNEYGVRVADVEEFQASKYLVSNGEFLDFVRDGGYQTQAYWTDEGYVLFPRDGSMPMDSRGRQTSGDAHCVSVAGGGGARTSRRRTLCSGSRTGRRTATAR